MNIKYTNQQPLSKPPEPIFNQRSYFLKLLVAIGLIVVVIMNAAYLLPAAPSGPENTAVVIPTEAEATVTFKAEADAHVEESHPDQNVGTFGDLKVIQASGQSMESYLRFTVRDVPGVIQSARLQIYSTTDEAENGPALYATDTTWNETEITWNNRPALLGNESSNQNFIRRYSWVEYDVTDLVTGDGTYSFVLSGESDEELRFSSRESSNGPQLVITYASATPTSAAAPATATAAPGDKRTFAAEADTHIAEASPAENFGTSAELHASEEEGFAQISYLRFTVSGITGSNHRVALRLFAISGGSVGPTVHFGESEWAESGEEGVTWEGQPTLLSGPVGTPGTIQENSWVEYDVSAVVTRDGTYTFALIANGSDDLTFSSREGTAAPELVVTAGLVVPTPTALPTHAATDGELVLVGAGDIASCSRNGDELTAKLLDTIPGTVFTLGDNAYVNGSYSDYLKCYEPSWGRHKARTKPIPGNHEYNTTGAAGYFQYFNNIPSYYAYDIGTWRVYALNSEIDVSLSSEQIAWLVQDLAQHPRQCVLAYWHTPRWSSGTESGSDSTTHALWQILYEAGAELVINGHEHNYERFAEMDEAGMAVSPGLRAIVVGTGGAGLYPFGTPLEASEVRDNSTFGVLKLTLHTNSYEWEFIPVGTSTFTDSGSSDCRE